MTIEPRKNCSRCGEAKSLDRFGRDKTRRDGLACWCKDCLNQNSRNWHYANREKVLAQHRKWYRENPPDRALVSERTRLWGEANPEKLRSLRKNAKHQRRARLKGGMTASEFRHWEASQAKVCHWCCVKCAEYEIDHRIPLSKGGKHERRNLVISCRPCNRSKGARCPIEFAQSKGKLV